MTPKALYMRVLISSINLIVFYFVGFPAFFLLLAEIAIYAFGNSSYWTLYYAMMYDISELDEFVNGDRREGAITAVMAFCQKLGAAVAMWLTGQILAWGQYGVEGADIAVANKAVLLSNTAIPGVVGLFCVAAIVAYPLTKDKFMALSAALAAKRAGEAYTTEGFEDLLK